MGTQMAPNAVNDPVVLKTSSVGTNGLSQTWSVRQDRELFKVWSGLMVEQHLNPTTIFPMSDTNNPPSC